MGNDSLTAIWQWAADTTGTSLAAHFTRRAARGTDRWKDRHRALGPTNRKEGKRHNAALICVARRRVDVLLAMLRDNAVYQVRPTTATA